MAVVKNLIDGLFDEMNRVRGMIVEYKSLPNNAGMLAASFMLLDIQRAENAIKDDDVIEMLSCYNELKKYENG